MELWIRSQDRTDLVKVNALWVIENQIWMEVPFYENHKKIGLTITGHNHQLAEYKTKERALEVLDEIQSLLRPTFKINYEYDDSQPIIDGEWLKSLKAESKIEELSCYVYEMPKE